MSDVQLELFPKWLEYGFYSDEAFYSCVHFYEFLFSNNLSVFDRIKECDLNRHSCFIACWYSLKFLVSRKKRCN